MSDLPSLVERLRELARFEHGDVSFADEAADEIENLRKALEPFANLFLWPDDLGTNAAKDIRSDPDWDELGNDQDTEELSVLRGHIRHARNLLKRKLI
jgi:hypothetical protein